jgi:hypothetical protein
MRLELSERREMMPLAKMAQGSVEHGHEPPRKRQITTHSCTKSIWMPYARMAPQEQAWGLEVVSTTQVVVSWVV